MPDLLESRFSDPPSGFSGEVRFNEPLARFTYYQIGGPARVLVTPKSKEDLKWVAQAVSSSGAAHFLLGAGSNLLVSDEGFDGVVIRLNKLNSRIDAEPNGSLYAGGSAMISVLLRRAAQEGWGGLEFLTGIPGTVGGAVRMNAGTHLGETASRLGQVEALIFRDLPGDPMTERIYSGPELKFQYRKNLFLPAGAVVFGTRWRIEPRSPQDVKRVLDETLKRRKETQPIDYPSCGSVFKNPKEAGLSAWQVVEKLGLRGYRIGCAQISEKHGNFILNLGGAKASDVRALITLVKARALSELGIPLQEEVIYVGPSSLDCKEQP